MTASYNTPKFTHYEDSQKIIFAFKFQSRISYIIISKDITKDILTKYIILPKEYHKVFSTVLISSHSKDVCNIVNRFGWRLAFTSRVQKTQPSAERRGRGI